MSSKINHLLTNSELGTPNSELLIDSYGRIIDELRISITKRCNLRCIYCHNEGLGTHKKSRELTPKQLERYAKVASSLGIKHIKLTGGEPLVRTDIVEIVKRLAKYCEVSMTTNATYLTEELAKKLKSAGLSRINISIDTLDKELFYKLRGTDIKLVINGVQSALKAKLTPVKLNIVLTRETLQTFPEILDFAKSNKGITVQVIQFMPENVDDCYQQIVPVDINYIHIYLKELSSQTEIRKIHKRKVYTINGVKVEVVDPVDNPDFCANCRRIRLTPEGHFKGCLNQSFVVPVEDPDNETLIEERFRKVVRERIPYYGVIKVGKLKVGTFNL